MKRAMRFIGRFADPLYILANVGAIAFVLYAGVITTP
jgi:hypothetical protein